MKPIKQITSSTIWGDSLIFIALAEDGTLYLGSVGKDGATEWKKIDTPKKK